MQARHRATPYLFVAPAVVLFAAIVLGPIAATGVFSFFRWDGFGAFEAIGLRNYWRAINDPIVRASLWHAVVYIALTLVLEVAVGMALAGMLTARARSSIVFRVAFFVPVMLPMVVVAVVWSFVLNPDLGLLNATLEAIGLESLTQVWLGDERTALASISVVSGWVFAGFYMAIFYAAFRQLPTEVIEAAQLDGANAVQVFWRVKVPMVRRTAAVAVLLCVTGGLQSFDLFYVLTNGGPYGSTEIPTTYLVKVVFRNQEVGYGSAIAMLLTALVVIVGLGFMLARRGDRRATR